MSNSKAGAWRRIMSAVLAAGLVLALAGPGNAVNYAGSDTWVLAGATDWTNRNPFVGKGAIADLSGGADTNTVWAMMRYGDVGYTVGVTNVFKQHATLLNTYTNHATLGRYRYLTPNSYFGSSDLKVSPTSMVIRPSWGAREAAAVRWQAPVAGTVRLETDVNYAGNGQISCGVFLEDTAAGKFYQLNKGILYPWAGLTNAATVNVTVSVNAGDRLLLVNRLYWHNGGSDPAYQAAWNDSNHRWSYHRNLTVTYLDSALTHRPAARQTAWRRQQVYWRADLSGLSNLADPLIAYDRRDPDVPPVFYHYLTTNSQITNTVAGLTAGETLRKPTLNDVVGWGTGSGQNARQIGDRGFYTPLATSVAPTNSPVCIFRPPKPGVYDVSGPLTHRIAGAFAVNWVKYWIGVAEVSAWGPNPTINAVSLLAQGKLGLNVTSNVNVRFNVPTANHGIYMAVTGYGGGGTIGSRLDDQNLKIEYFPSGTAITIQ